MFADGSDTTDGERQMSGRRLQEVQIQRGLSNSPFNAENAPTGHAGVLSFDFANTPHPSHGNVCVDTRISPAVNPIQVSHRHRDGYDMAPSRSPFSGDMDETEEDNDSFNVDEQQGKQRGRVGVDLGFEDAPSSRWDGIKRLCSNVWQTLKMWRLFVQLSLIDIRSRTCAFCLGLFSVLVVVVLCVSLLSILSSLPVVFLLLAQNDRGAIDLSVRPGGQLSQATSLNYTAISEIFPHNGSDSSFHAPRIRFTLDTNIPSRCKKPIYGDNDSLWMNLYGTGHCRESWCVNQRCPSPVATNFFAFNSTLEDRMGLGNVVGLRSPKEGHVIITRRLAFLLGDVKVGEEIIAFGRTVFAAQAYPSNASQISTFVIMRLIVERIIGEEKTKFPGVGEDYAVLGYNAMGLNLADGLYPELPADIIDSVRRTDPNEYAGEVLFNLPPGRRRLHAYQSSDFDTVQRRVMTWAAPIVAKLGVSQVTGYAPLVRFLYGTRMFSVFVGLIMSIIILAMAFLSIMLIYSLLTVGLETRTFELGVQRMVGFTRENLVASVLCNAYFFAIPAWLFGLFLGQGLYSVIRVIVDKLVDLDLPKLVSGSSIGWATLAGLMIPLVASIFPILGLLTLRLPEALDSSHGRNAGVVYKIVRGGSERLDGTMLGLGFLFALFGFLLYYLFPNSVITMDLTLMFYIFFCVLIGMLAGLVLLATNFQRVIETVLQYLLFFWERSAVFRMVQKSLAAHRPRNRKTTLMYALSMSFIVFITVAFDIQMKAFEYSTLSSYGSEIRVSLRNTGILDYADLRQYVEKNAPGLASGFTYTPLSYESGTWQQQKLLVSSDVGSLGRYRQAGDWIVSIPPNYYTVLDKRFLKVDKHTAAANRYSLSGALYTRDSLNALLLSTSAFDYLGLKRPMSGAVVVTNTIIANNTANKRVWQRIAIQAAAALDSSPTLSASKFPSTYGDKMASIPVAVRLSGDPQRSALGLQLQYMHVRVPNEKDYPAVMNAISRWSTSQATLVRSVTQTTADMRSASQFLSFFFIFTMIMILVICFFSLMSSMTSNILESSKEIGVLLCLGMTHFEIYRIYVQEAFILVLSSGLLGLAVGMVVAYTMQMQNVLFTQLPLPFAFPYVQLIIIAGVGIISALASSISPVAFLLGLPSVTHIIRRSGH